MDLHDVSQAKTQVRGARARGAHNPLIAAKEAHARRRMHMEMTTRFQAQLQRYKANLGSNANRSALINPDRAINVTRSGRSNQRTRQTLHFTNSQQVAKVQRFVNGTQITARGLLVLDFGLRTNWVGNTYYNGGDAVRMGITQYSGFDTGAATGYLVGVGTKAIGLALMLSPAGWVVLIGAAAVVGFGAATLADNGVQKATGYGYDTVSGYIRVRR